MPPTARLFAVTIDAADPLELARFYQAIAGGEVTRGSDDFVVLSGGAVRIDFQRVANPVAGWPDGSPRRVHLDFLVDDLAEGEAYALRLGAVLADHQPGGRRFRVMVDPAGHPFCLADKEAGATPTQLPPGGRYEFAGQADLAAGFTRVETTGGRVRATEPDAPAGMAIRPMRPADAGQVLAIYQAGIDGGQASFETAAPTWEEFDAGRLRPHRHVAIDSGTGELHGWIAVSATSRRQVYAGVVEHSVYVAPGMSGRGVGSALLQALIDSTEAAGVWTIQSGVFPENTASLRLHERAGFRVVGVRSRVGRHHGRWRDVVLLERRSDVAGTD